MPAQFNHQSAVNDNTNARVVYWACFEAFLLIVMTVCWLGPSCMHQFAQVGQIYYLNRFFEVRSKV